MGRFRNTGDGKFKNAPMRVHSLPHCRRPKRSERGHGRQTTTSALGGQHENVPPVPGFLHQSKKAGRRCLLPASACSTLLPLVQTRPNGWPTCKPEPVSFRGTNFCGRLPLFPGHTQRLAHELRRVGARLRRELLRLAGMHFGRVQVAALVHAELVHTPHLAGP